MKSLFLALLLLPVLAGAQIISTIAGPGTAGVLGDGGPAIAAEILVPQGVATDTAGNVFITDLSHMRIRKIDASGIITTIAGTGVRGCTGDGGPATAAEIKDVSGIIADKRGNIFFCDYGCNVIRKIDNTGTITTVAGNGTGGYSGDGGPATAAKILTPRNIAVDTAGNLYFTEQSNQIVRKVSASGLIYTFAGNGTIGFSGDGGSATAAQFNGPVGVTCDDSGNVYIADWRNYRIRKVNASGIISTFAGIGVAGITGDGGPATAAHLEPSGNLGFDKLGNLICTDGIGNVIRIIDHSGTIYRIAGTGISGFSGDGGPATAATMKGPCATAINAAGDIYIVDAVNNRIRKITDYTSLLVGNTSSKNDFSIFPNPANSKITISSTQMIRKVTIYNLEGQVVYTANCFANNLPVDVSGLSNGIYFVKINDSETRQFVKSER